MDAGIRGTPGAALPIGFERGLGGRIIRNKLWFFGAGSLKAYDREVLDAFMPDGTPVVLTTDMHYYVTKISYQATPSNRFAGFYHKAQDMQVRDASRMFSAGVADRGVQPGRRLEGRMAGCARQFDGRLCAVRGLRL